MGVSRPPDAILVGESAAITPGKVAMRYLSKTPQDDQQALIMRTEKGELRAYRNQCQHIAIPLDAGTGEYLTPDGKRLRCVTHGAEYLLDDGLCICGPCQGDSLEALQLYEQDEQLFVIRPAKMPPAPSEDRD